MKAEKFIDFLEHLVSEASGKIIVFTDRHPAHEAQAVEDWLEGRESQIELEWLPRMRSQGPSKPSSGHFFLDIDLRSD
jgi:hypothetical protein